MEDLCLEFLTRKVIMSDCYFVRNGLVQRDIGSIVRGEELNKYGYA